jgi:retron-type reverse transcriptase
MRTAETLLHIIHARGTRGLPWDDVYRQLLHPDRYLRASARLPQHAGATTPGTTAEPVEGMAQANITKSIEALRDARGRWTPVRRVAIPTSHGKTRPLGLPTWSDTRRQAVIRARLRRRTNHSAPTMPRGFDRGREATRP